jgi:hypothetical protein
MLDHIASKTDGAGTPMVPKDDGGLILANYGD